MTIEEIYDLMWAATKERMELRIDQDYDEWLEWLFAAEQAKCEHEFVDASYAGPESGNMDVECRKCGLHVSVPLY